MNTSNITNYTLEDFSELSCPSAEALQRLDGVRMKNC